MELGSRSFRLPRSSSYISRIIGGSKSFRLPRSNSSLTKIVSRSKNSHLVIESVTLEYVGLVSYERLDSIDDQPRRQKTGIQRFLSQVFSHHERGDRKEAKKEANIFSLEGKRQERRRSSWLPDPSKRWPVQGW